ncbi:dTMP kinase [Rheinheimera soli]|uniref:dTMP kinase n=1 Tax=Rheinheimera soli TaxID=443616 RepID=UPI001E45D452|nr:dTMP kinase [Rheinheimera soli]
MKKGFMLVVDGGNGAGKTTVIATIKSYLEGKGVEVVVTREPGGTPIGEKIRQLILDPDTPEICDKTELFLFAAARAQHLHEKILPALEHGKVVVSDRFDTATISFQHYARGIDIDLINKINGSAVGDFKPAMNLILDIDPELGLERVHQRGEKLDRLEKEKVAFLEKARMGYLKQAEQEPTRFRIVDASKSKEYVEQEALKVVEELLTKYNC